MSVISDSANYPSSPEADHWDISRSSDQRAHIPVSAVEASAGRADAFGARTFNRFYSQGHQFIYKREVCTMIWPAANGQVEVQLASGDECKARLSELKPRLKKGDQVLAQDGKWHFLGTIEDTGNKIFTIRWNEYRKCLHVRLNSPWAAMKVIPLYDLRVLDRIRSEPVEDSFGKTGKGYLV
jgi:hypothetical protein